MPSQESSRPLSPEELQQLCDVCKLALGEPPNLTLKEAMGRLCDNCKKGKAHLPDLVELRRHLHEMNEKLSDELT